jgi:hypothetical protein
MIGAVLARDGRVIHLGDPSDPSNCVWSITGTYDHAFGSFSINATLQSDPNGTPEVHCVSNSFTGFVDKPGCHNAHGTSADGIDMNWSKPCDIPTGEILRPAGQWPDGDPRYAATTFDWFQTLTPAEVNFSGRRVSEAFEQVAGSDSCWFDKSKYPNDVMIDDGVWLVDETNTYALDEVGYSVAGVKYYRSRNKAPCRMAIRQHMQIDCADGLYEFASHVLVISMTATTVSAAKDSSVQTTTWP